MEVPEASGGSLPLMESLSKSRNHRHCLLYAWGVTFLSIAHTAYRMVEELHGPFGSLSQKLGSLASPAAYTMQYEWLKILSFADDQILALEDVVESLFPPSAFVFDMIDILADISVTLPGKLNGIVDHFKTVVIERLPFLNWAMTHFGIGLGFLISMLTDWDTGCMKDEREIMVDINSHGPASETLMEDPKGAKQVERQHTVDKQLIFSERQHPKIKVGLMEKVCADDHDHTEKPTVFDDTKYAKDMAGKTNDFDNLPIFSDTKQDQTKMGMTKKSHILSRNDKKHIESVCREILGALENANKESDHTFPIHAAAPQAGTRAEHIEKVVKDDLILELFETGWHSKRESKRGR